MHQTHDFTGLVVDDRAIAEAHAARVRSLELHILHLKFTATKWPRQWTGARAVEAALLRADLARAMTDEACHLHAMEARGRTLMDGLDRLEALIDALPEPKEATA